MTKQIKKSGFTLIELLVVIAIIGMLASIVLASLNTARNKGADAAIKGNLSSIRTQAEVYYDTNTGYSSAVIASLPVSSCTTGTSVFIDSTVTSAIAAVTTASGGTVVCNLGGTSGSKASSWAVSSPLKTTGHWCVDSTGASRAIGAALGTSPTVITACPAS